MTFFYFTPHDYFTNIIVQVCDTREEKGKRKKEKRVRVNE